MAQADNDSAIDGSKQAVRGWIVERLRLMASAIEEGVAEAKEFTEPREVEDIPGTNPVQRRFTGRRTISVTVQLGDGSVLPTEQEVLARLEGAA